MRSPTERASASRGPRAGSLLTTLLAALCAAAPAFAQAPECAWGNGVALPGGDTRDVLSTRDGAAGLLAITWQVNIGTVYTSTIRLHHVLEQGWLDPALPADGAVIMSPAMLPERPEYIGVRVVPDGAGGAYVLFRACISTLAHLRCWEMGDMRLKHVTGQGATVPGWPEAGLALHARPSPDPRQTADIVADGLGGVIAAWVDTVNYALSTPPVRAQRFAADGAARWPGGLAGIDVLGPQTNRANVRLAGDGAGGCVVVTSQLAPGSSTRYELKAGRVKDDASLPWSSAGRTVMAQPTASSDVHAVVMDLQGRAFVTALNTPTGSGTPYFWSQLLNPSGTRLWSLSGVDLGVANGSSSPAFVTPVGFVSVHGGQDGTPRLQLQNVTGYPSWGSGIAADWVDTPLTHRPLITAEGHVLSLWQSSGASPPSEVRAVELDESGALAAGWPSPWAVVCGNVSGRIFMDAFVSGPHTYVAWASDERSGVLPLMQRLSPAVLGVEETRASRPLELSPPVPNPARGAWSVRVSVRDPALVTLDAFDVAGRRVLERDLGLLSPGAHFVQVDAGASLAPGLYRVRVRAGVHWAERMVIRIR